MQFTFPAIINEKPTRGQLKAMGSIKMMNVALKIVGNIYIRCRLAEAQNWKCCWCGVECVPESNFPNSATVEHVTPRSMGGIDHWDNYAMACGRCNHGRGSTPVAEMLEGKVKKVASLSKAKEHRRRVKVNKTIRTGLKLAERGWVKVDGSPISPDEWLQSLQASEKQESRIRQAVFGG